MSISLYERKKFNTALSWKQIDSKGNKIDDARTHLFIAMGDRGMDWADAYQRRHCAYWRLYCIHAERHREYVEKHGDGMT